MKPMLALIEINRVFLENPSIFENHIQKIWGHLSKLRVFEAIETLLRVLS